MPKEETPRDSKQRNPPSLFEGWLLLMEERRALAEIRRSGSVSLVSVSNPDQRIEVPFVPTSLETARKMLEIAEVGHEDVVFDLGCGDARILLLAVEVFNVKKAVGYEIRNDVYATALKEVGVRNFKERVRIVHGDLFDADLSEATVITLYLNHGVNNKLRPKLEKEAKPGARIVSHDFEVPSWRPKRKVKLQSDNIYLYIVPESFQDDQDYKDGWRL